MIAAYEDGVCVRCGEQIHPPDAPIEDACLAVAEHRAWDHGDEQAEFTLRSFWGSTRGGTA